MVNVTNSTHVCVGFFSFKFFFISHFFSSIIYFYIQLGAGEGNRTLTTSLEGWCSTIELHPHHSKRITLLILSKTLLILVEGEGFEPSKTEVNGFTARPI